MNKINHYSPFLTMNEKHNKISFFALLQGTSKWLRTLVWVALIAAVGGGIFFLQQRMQKKSRIERTITQTITQIKAIKELCTANYCEETVISASRKKVIGSDDIAIIVKGTVRAGFDLSRMETEVLSDTAIVITLPKAKVLDVITNPSDCETFQESGKWSHEKVTRYKDIARRMILRHALADGLLHDAQQNGEERLRLFFGAMGFTSVEVVFEG